MTAGAPCKVFPPGLSSLRLCPRVLAPLAQPSRLEQGPQEVGASWPSHLGHLTASALDTTCEARGPCPGVDRGHLPRSILRGLKHQRAMGGSLSHDTRAHVTQRTHDFLSPGTSWKARTRESRGEGTPEAGGDPGAPGSALGPAEVVRWWELGPGPGFPRSYAASSSPGTVARRR